MYNVAAHNLPAPTRREDAPAQMETQDTPREVLQRDPRLASIVESMDANTKKYRDRFNAKNILSGMNRFEERQETAAAAWSEATQNLIKGSSTSERRERVARRVGRGVEIVRRSGPFAVIGAAAIGGAFLTGGASLVAVGVGAARVGARTSRGYRRGQNNYNTLNDNRNETGEGFDEVTARTAGITAGEDDGRFIRAGVKAANALSLLERKTTERSLKRAEKKGALTDKDVLRAHAVGSAANTAFMLLGADKFRDLMEGMTGTARAQAGRESAATSTETSTTPATGGTTAPSETPRGGTLRSPGSTQPPAPETPSDPTTSTSDTDKKYNESEAHRRNRQVTEGLFDGTERNSKETDTHVLNKAKNNPELMAEILEVQESGNVDFSVSDVNEDIASYTKGADYGEYNKTGEKAVNKLERTWENGEKGKVLSDNQAQKMLSKYNLINHGTRNGAGANDKVFSAGAFDYRPDLGDKIYAKELGNGRTVFFKVNEQTPSRDCLNVLTLEKKPSVSEAPVQPAVPSKPIVPTQPESPGKPRQPEPGMRMTPPKDVPNKPVIDKPEPKPEPKPEDKPPEPKPEDKPPEVPPPFNDDKRPEQDSNVNDRLPPQVGMGDDRMPQGPPTVLQPRPDTYTPPQTAQPEVGRPATPATGSQPVPGRTPVTSSPEGPTATMPNIPSGNGSGTTNNGSSGGPV